MDDHFSEPMVTWGSPIFRNPKMWINYTLDKIPLKIGELPAQEPTVNVQPTGGELSSIHDRFVWKMDT